MAKKEKHIHHHWCDTNITLKTVFWALIILLIISTMLTTASTEISKNQDIYKSCLDACVSKPFYWLQNPLPINIDRTECITSCNKFYTIIE